MKCRCQCPALSSFPSLSPGLSFSRLRPDPRLRVRVRRPPLPLQELGHGAGGKEVGLHPGRGHQASAVFAALAVIAVVVVADVAVVLLLVVQLPQSFWLSHCGGLLKAALENFRYPLSCIVARSVIAKQDSCVRSDCHSPSGTKVEKVKKFLDHRARAGSFFYRVCGT